jgi:hypothetical protein
MFIIEPPYHGIQVTHTICVSSRGKQAHSKRFRTSPIIRKKSILSSASNLNQSFELAGAK